MLCAEERIDNLYFISCWHVIKDNINWDLAPVNKKYNQRPDQKILGTIEEGFLSHDDHIGIDIGIGKFIDKAMRWEMQNS